MSVMMDVEGVLNNPDFSGGDLVFGKTWEDLGFNFEEAPWMLFGKIFGVCDDVADCVMNIKNITEDGEGIDLTTCIGCPDVPDCSPALDGCRAPGEPDDPDCLPPASCAAGKPLSLAMSYSGENCPADTTIGNDRKSLKVSCTGFGSDSATLTAELREKKELNSKLLWGPHPIVNGVFTIAPESFKADTYVLIRESNGTFVQQIRFHTSCSQPLNEGDIFGPLELIKYFPRP